MDNKFRDLNDTKPSMARDPETREISAVYVVEFRELDDDEWQEFPEPALHPRTEQSGRRFYRMLAVVPKQDRPIRYRLMKRVRQEVEEILEEEEL